jgi:hypothetical protein
MQESVHMEFDELEKKKIEAELKKLLLKKRR